MGTYDLLVDGADVADIVVTTTKNGTKGEVEFTSGDDDSDEQPLTFDPAVLSNPRVTNVPSGAALVLNTNQSGSGALGVSVTLPAGI